MSNSGMAKAQPQWRHISVIMAGMAAYRGEIAYRQAKSASSNAINGGMGAGESNENGMARQSSVSIISGDQQQRRAGGAQHNGISQR